VETVTVHQQPRSTVVVDVRRRPNRPIETRYSQAYSHGRGVEDTRVRVNPPKPKHKSVSFKEPHKEHRSRKDDEIYELIAAQNARIARRPQWRPV
jgi:hypothetical protein